MHPSLISIAEEKALKAIDLPAFQSISLGNIKDSITKILGLIGRNDLFEQYTKHDISHINSLLNNLDWLIPNSTQEIMTDADWLMIVLAIYFHDLGMLITKNEYERREATDFVNYKKEVLDGIKYGNEFKKKVLELKGEAVDKFLYQEFVRQKHAERIRNWIKGNSDVYIGDAQEIITELDKLLNGLPAVFRRDLGLVCESHHLDDLDDFEKYKINYSYGSSSQEEVNLQYAALVLRLADLLNITNERTPSIEYRLINPSDPLSQEEWNKQMAVNSVKPKPKKEDGKIDRSLQSDTILVTAYFDKPEKANGFFALTRYITYCRQQFKKCQEWTQNAKQVEGSRYEIPWINIDESAIETVGFEKKLFEFVLDQDRILKLLVGHTLYNDTSVVIRELLQNSIDAIRLREYIQKKKSTGCINVLYNSENRELSILDNGTGMTQEIIERHLLKVGSSRYQNDIFKKDFPNFSSISRFGIGILTCFMISDEIEITSLSMDSSDGNKLSIRNIDGKYLLQKIDRNKLRETFSDGYGTLIKLKVRESADLNNLKDNIEKWIVFPPCKIQLNVDELKTEIGFSSPKEALEILLSNQGHNGKNLKVIQKETDDVELAFIVEYSNYFKTWNFAKFQKDFLKSSLGTCIHGVRVEFDTPGFQGKKIIAIANCFGRNIPKTNVARSTIEQNTEQERLISNIYNLFSEHIIEQIDSQQKEGFSLTWAVKEANHILAELTNDSYRTDKETFIPQNEALFNKAIREMPLFLIETNNIRKNVSNLDIDILEELWTVDSETFSSAESLITQVKTTTSVTNVVEAIQKDSHINFKNLLCKFYNFNSLQRNCLEGKEVTEIHIYPSDRRVDLRWQNIGLNPHWLSIQENLQRSSRLESTAKLQLSEIKIEGLNDETAIASNRILFILNNSAIHSFLLESFKELDLSNLVDRFKANTLINLSISLLRISQSTSKIEDVFKNHYDRTLKEDIMIADDSWINKELLFETISKTKWKVFDPSAWNRDRFLHLYH